MAPQALFPLSLLILLLLSGSVSLSREGPEGHLGVWRMNVSEEVRVQGENTTANATWRRDEKLNLSIPIDLVQTTCHVVSDDLVATAKATVSSYLEDICDSAKMINTTLLIREEFKREITVVKHTLHLLKEKLDLLIKYLL